MVEDPGDAAHDGDGDDEGDDLAVCARNCLSVFPLLRERDMGR